METSIFVESVRVNDTFVPHDKIHIQRMMYNDTIHVLGAPVLNVPRQREDILSVSFRFPFIVPNVNPGDKALLTIVFYNEYGQEYREEYKTIITSISEDSMSFVAGGGRQVEKPVQKQKEYSSNEEAKELLERGIF